MLYTQKHNTASPMKSLYLCYFNTEEPLVHTQVLPYLRAIAQSAAKTQGRVHPDVTTADDEDSRRPTNCHAIAVPAAPTRTPGGGAAVPGAPARRSRPDVTQATNATFRRGL